MDEKKSANSLDASGFFSAVGAVEVDADASLEASVSLGTGGVSGLVSANRESRNSVRLSFPK